MSASAAELERTTLQRLRKDFEAKGYEFVEEPSRSQRPDFLGEHIPDALALGEHDKVIIEVKRRESGVNKIPLAQVAKKVPSGSGWRYLLVYAGQDLDEIVDLPRPTQMQVSAAIQETRRLEESGYNRAAMLESWTILEALARRLFPEDIRFSLRPLSSMQIVERLASEGEVNAEQARRLRLLSSLRNALAHGNLAISVSTKDVQEILALIDEINTRARSDP